MIAPGLLDIADRLLAGTIEPAVAGRILKAQAEGVQTIERRFASVKRSARVAILNTIALRECMAELENEIPRTAAAADPEQPLRLAREQPCGCLVCTCEDEERCHGCGAKNCGTDRCVFKHYPQHKVYEGD